MQSPQVVSGMKLHCAGYGRQSYGRVNGSEASPTTQRDANQARFNTFAAEAARQGREAVWCGHYEDVGISAYSGTERPDFERLLRDCRMGRINVVIVYNVARFSRLEPLDALPIVQELMKLGVTIVSVAEGVFRPGEMMDLIHLFFRLDAAYQESKNKSTAVRDTAALARSLGGYVGGKAPYGRRLKPETRTAPNGKPVAIQTLVTQPDEAEVIQRIVKALLDGTDSVHSMCATLNTEGVPTLGASRGKKTAGSSWHPKTLISMLRHPHLSGFDSEPVYNANGRVTGHRIRRDAEGKPARVWEPILGEADWFAVQEWLDARPVRMNEHRTTALLSSQGILVCACGCSKSANNAERPSYFCNRPAGKPVDPNKPGDHEGRSYVSRTALDDHVVRSIFALIAAAEWDEESREILARVAAHYAEVNETPETAQERQTVLHDRADAMRAINQLHDDKELYAGDPISHARWGDDLRTQQDRLRGANARLEELGQAGSLELPIFAWTESDNGDPLGPGSWWESASLAERREFVALFCKRITVRKALPSEKSRGNKARAVLDGRVTIEWV
ncbi:recombinase family protein [Streptomyces sp. DT2A-34]|uniref:recombinase family protein n=1 Tax=Streptomyces sp. DT2A-34 TaxID=3051182 RepID=UPI00265C17A3|nr:recombinase family protein [Streptomyces sp. DT2A-34]MDO0913007.1 recombinase family protein [Streptomyces sp. DT2A-34]